MKITLHGAAQEVGRSCVEVKEAGIRFLFDSGLKIAPTESLYPHTPTDLKNVKAIFLSHCHLDHCGALPYFFHRGFAGNVFCTSMTKSITRIILKDNWKVSRIKNFVQEYNKKDINKILDNFKIINNYSPQQYEGIKFVYQDAGHIPGASSIAAEINKKTVLYSGDINTSDTRLVGPARIETRNPDAFIIETTYGDREHEDRDLQEKDFLNTIKETLDDDGKVLIPTFAIGRAQEMLLLLARKDFGVPIYLDGMAKKVAHEYINDPTYIKNPNELKRAFERAHPVDGRKERENIVKEQAIFLTTSGMMDGGPVLDYIKHFWFEERNSILMTGYQTEGSNGRLLIEKKHLLPAHRKWRDLRIPCL